MILLNTLRHGLKCPWLSTLDLTRLYRDIPKMPVWMDRLASESQHRSFISATLYVIFFASAFASITCLQSKQFLLVSCCSLAILPPPPQFVPILFSHHLISFNFFSGCSSKSSRSSRHHKN